MAVNWITTFHLLCAEPRKGTPGADLSRLLEIRLTSPPPAAGACVDLLALEAQRVRVLISDVALPLKFR